jgi:hypothetical protein
MSREATTWVRLPRTPDLERLLSDAGAARRRLEKAPPGDRGDAARFEALCAELEQLAVAANAAGAVSTGWSDATGRSSSACLTDADASLDTLDPSIRSTVHAWLTAGDIAVELRDPFVDGPTSWAIGPGAPPVQEAWEARGAGRNAVRERFVKLVEEAADGRDGAAIVPSGISNSVLTDVLRDFSRRDGERPAVLAPVRYRDGSRSHPFPLRGLPLREEAGEPGRSLRFALLSIRHTEMDAEVDGAWLRNAVVSRQRPAGDTDTLVYDISRQQLERLIAHGPLRLYMHQTGLEPAIVGFYRAVAEALQRVPAGTLTVIPCFFRQGPDGRSRFVEGAPWTT